MSYWFRKELLHKGGPGSGNFGHKGRPGEIGGSASDGGGGGGETSSIKIKDLKPGDKFKDTMGGNPGTHTLKYLADAKQKGYKIAVTEGGLQIPLGYKDNPVSVLSAGGGGNDLKPKKGGPADPDGGQPRAYLNQSHRTLVDNFLKFGGLDYEDIGSVDKLATEVMRQTQAVNMPDAILSAAADYLSGVRGAQEEGVDEDGLDDYKRDHGYEFMNKVAPYFSRKNNPSAS